MTDTDPKPTRRKEFRDAALGLLLLLAALGFVLYELRSGYEDFRLLGRGIPSFAYVTRARANWASKNGARSDRCELEGLLPRETQTHAPQTQPDMSGSSYFDSSEPDSDRTCPGNLHTWQPVLIDPDDRSHARFAWGLRASASQAVAIVVALVALALVAAAVQAVQRVRARRRAP